MTQVITNIASKKTEKALPLLPGKGQKKGIMLAYLIYLLRESTNTQIQGLQIKAKQGQAIGNYMAQLDRELGNLHGAPVPSVQYSWHKITISSTLHSRGRLPPIVTHHYKYVKHYKNQGAIQAAQMENERIDVMRQGLTRSIMTLGQTEMIQDNQENAMTSGMTQSTQEAGNLLKTVKLMTGKLLNKNFQ